MTAAPERVWISHHKRGLSPIHHTTEPTQPDHGKPINYVPYRRSDTVVDKEVAEKMAGALGHLANNSKCPSSRGYAQRHLSAYDEATKESST